MKIVTVLGARPQFIKAAVVSRVIRDNYSEDINEVIAHTGQHYDENMSKIFFDELDIPKPKYNLCIAGGSHGCMTGRMLEAIEQVLLDEKPDYVLVYGDTNSTLAGALAASKIHIPIAHVEAGLRSFNMRMPEEINRLLVDRISTLLFCPTETAVINLNAEGLVEGVHNIGDVMYDAALFYKKLANKSSNILNQMNLTNGGYVLATCHRAENTDNSARLTEILYALVELAEQYPVVLPLHPRTRKLINDYNLAECIQKIHVTDPLSYIDMIALEQSAKVILTDSGGVQKEAYFYGVPCLTMRDETEWVETLEYGRNRLVGADRKKIIAAVSNMNTEVYRCTAYGEGCAGQDLVKCLFGYSHV